MDIDNWSNPTHCPNISTTPITAMGCRQCLPLSVFQLKGKNCRKPHCRNGIIDTFRQSVVQGSPSMYRGQKSTFDNNLVCCQYLLIIYLGQECLKSQNKSIVVGIKFEKLILYCTASYDK